MWPQAPVCVTPPQAVGELHLEGAPTLKPGCRLGVQLGRFFMDKLVLLSLMGAPFSSLLIIRWMGKVRSSSVQTVWSQCRGSSTAMARGRLEEDEEIKERKEDRETCGRDVVTVMLWHIKQSASYHHVAGCCAHTPLCVCVWCTSVHMHFHTCACVCIWGRGWEAVKEI